MNVRYNNNRIIAIGDIHGDYLIFIELLKLAKVIDNFNNWIGGSTYVVQLGDTLDGKRPETDIEIRYLKKPYELKINFFILKLDNEAKKCNGRVISILGNHEFYPYYKYNDLQFNDDYVKKSDIKEYQERFNQSRFDYYYPGKGEGAKLFGKTRPLLLKLGKFIFCHGSLSVDFLKMYSKNNLVDISLINKEVRDWLMGKSKIKPKFIDKSDSYNPLFNRELTDPVSMSEKECTKIIYPLFKYLPGVKYIVMGHSSHKNINTLCDNRVYRTDIAISRAFGGSLQDKMSRLQVLEILQSKNKIKTRIITPNGTKIIIK